MCENLLVATDKMEYLEGQSRRNNLVFDGIAESPGETWAEAEEKVKKVLAEREAPDCSPQTEPTWRGRALSPHGGGGHSVHIEEDWSASTAFLIPLAEIYQKLPEIRVCPPERVMAKTCK